MVNPENFLPQLLQYMSLAAIIPNDAREHAEISNNGGILKE